MVGNARRAGQESNNNAVYECWSSGSFFQWLSIDLDQNHGEVFVRSAALMRSAPWHDYDITFLDFDGLAVDDARAAPLTGIGFFRRIEFSAQHERGRSIQHVVD